MKQLAAVLLLGALATVILQPVASLVNTPSVNIRLIGDGSTPPPPFPPKPSAALLGTTFA